MSRVRIAVILCVLLSANAAYAVSLINVPTERIRDYLAEVRVAAFYCDEVNLRHNMVDLIWDILELKTGSSTDDESEIEAFAERADFWELKFRDDLDAACRQAYARFGADGSEMPDVLYLR